MNWAAKGLLFCGLLLFIAIQAHGRGMGGDFSLTDHDGQPFELSQLRGKLVLLFFGYTYCPDICPTELSNISAVFDGLGEQADQVHGLFVSLDPERDTPEVLRRYTQYFSSSLTGLTGSKEQLDQVAGMYRVRYQHHEMNGGRYSIDHSANLYVIDREGRLASVVPYGLPPEHVLGLVQSLLRRPVNSLANHRYNTK